MLAARRWVWAAIFLAGVMAIAIAPASLAEDRAQPAPTKAPGLALFSQPPSPAPGQPAVKPVRWAYMVGNTLPASLRDHASQIDVISPNWFHAQADGSITGSDSPAVTQFARANHVQVIPIVANGNFTPSVAHMLLVDGNRQTAFLNSLQNLLQTYGYDGVNIDFENIQAADRDGFSALMSNVYARLHPLGKLVTAAIPSKTSEKYTGFAGPFDYAALSPNLDLAVIMAYDEHYAGSGPGPIADVAWVNDVLNYAQSQIPPSKLLLGIPFYGYDWGGGYARAMTYSDVVKTVFANGAQIHMDQASQSPWFSYQGHNVWFENSDSLRAKLNLVTNHALAGWAAWRLGQEDPNFWTLTLNS